LRSKRSHKPAPRRKRQSRAVANALAIDPTPPLTEDERVARSIALAGSVLRFRNIASEALNGLLVRMIAENAPMYASAFSTPTEQARPCLLVLAVGEEDTAMLAQAIQLVNKNRNEEDSQEQNA
jgi:hypothetical protein